MLGLTWDKYLLVCQELGQVPDESKKPLQFEELPFEAQLQVEIYNQMQDTYMLPAMSAPIYTGKDINNLTVLFPIYEVPVEDRALMLEFINIIDEGPIKKSRDAAIRQAKKGKKPTIKN